MTTTHLPWHRFSRGGCLYCGYHCTDCPPGVAVCKCGQSKKPSHTFEDDCPSHHWWCRLHWYTVWDADAHEMVHRAYPGSFNVLSSRNGWQRVFVHCGPSAFYPKKVRGNG